MVKLLKNFRFMKKNRLIIFAVIMSFCTSTTVSAVIVFFNSPENFFFYGLIDFY